MRFRDVQPDLRSLLATRFAALAVITPSLAGIAVIDNRGTQQNEQDIAESLRDKGVAISVHIPDESETTSQGAGKVVMNAGIIALLKINTERNDPDKNPDGANLDPYTGFEEAVGCVVNPTTRPTNEHDRWAFQGHKLDTSDAGLWVFALMFTKRCVL